MWEPKPRRVPLPLGLAPGLCEKTTSRLLAAGPARLTWLPVCAWELLLPSGPGPRHGQGVLTPLPRWDEPVTVTKQQYAACVGYFGEFSRAGWDLGFVR